MNTVILEKLEELWPGKFSDGEAKRFAGRFSSRPIDVVIAAMERFKDGSRFTPKVPEIEKLILAMANESKRASSVAAVQSPTFAQTIRQLRAASDRPLPAGLDDWEVIAGYWRGQWVRYAIDANKRRQKLGNQETKAAAAALVAHARQAGGMAKRCRESCEGCLISEWLPNDWAKYVAGAITGTGDDFDAMLRELRKELKSLRAEADQRKRDAAEQEYFPPSSVDAFDSVPEAQDPQANKIKFMEQVAQLQRDLEPATEPETAGV